MSAKLYMYQYNHTKIYKGIATNGCNYSTPPLMTTLQTNNSVLIRDVSFGERECYIHDTCAAKNLCPF